MFISKFLRHYTAVYILRHQRQNFFSCVLREQKKKNKVCVLAPYQDVLIFSLLKDTKND